MSDAERIVRGTMGALEYHELWLKSIHDRRVELGPNYQFLAEQIVEEVLKYRAPLDELIGLADYQKTYGPPRPDDGTPAALPVAPAAAEPAPAAP